jgi:putative ABC transport system permease protein
MITYIRIYKLVFLFVLLNILLQTVYSQSENFTNVRIDRDFISAYKITIVAGRNFNENISNDFGYIINESAVTKIGWKSPEEAIGRIIEYGGRKGNVIGVVRDFHYESLHNQISPIIMYYDPATFNNISIRVTSAERGKTLTFIEKPGWLIMSLTILLPMII